MTKRVDCFVCGKEGLTHNEIGLNKKLISRTIMKFHCINCLAEFLDVCVEDLVDRIEEFKDSDCTLFN